MEELVQLEQLTDVTLACGDGTNHQVDNDAEDDSDDGNLSQFDKLRISLNFSSSAPVRTLPYALGLLSVLPTAVEREPAQGEAPYHPPPRGQPETYAAVVALHVQVKISACLKTCFNLFCGSC